MCGAPHAARVIARVWAVLGLPLWLCGDSRVHRPSVLQQWNARTAPADCLSNPQSSSNVWLLAKPTKYEKMLMTAFSSKASAFHRSNSKFNAEL